LLRTWPLLHFAMSNGPNPAFITYSHFVDKEFTEKR
jgi:hypothetical protein